MKTELKPAKLPAGLKSALAKSPKAKAVFDKLPPSHKKEYVSWIAGAKKPETFRKRLEKMIPLLLAKAA